MLRVEGIRVDYAGKQALDGADLAVRGGERLALLGPSGSGKSTLLRTIAGLVLPDAGRVLLAGRDLAGVPPHARGIGLVHQHGVLFPHLDVAGNVAFGLRMAGLPRTQRERRTAELLALVGLGGFERRPVATLSGGESQRVALARALAPEPRILLLDEPLGALDRPLRERLLHELAELCDRLALTTVHVTHDVAEAFSIGHRVAVVREGRIVQHGEPDELWLHPADEWIARFLGLDTLRRHDGRTVGVRPEAVRLAPHGDALVVHAERRGATVHLRVRLADGQELEAVTTRTDHPRTGDSVSVSIDPAGVVDLSRGAAPVQPSRSLPPSNRS